MLKILLDFFPLLAFFIGYKLGDIYTAVTVLMLATAIQTVGSRLLSGKWQKMQLIGLAFALVFGGLTLWLHDDQFIKWKVSIFFWLQAAVFLIRLMLKKSTIQKMLDAASEGTLPLPTVVTRQIDLVWGLASLVVGTVNLYVAYQLSMDTWVAFKVWGVLFTYLVLFGYTAFAIHKYLPQEPEPETPAAKD